MASLVIRRNFTSINPLNGYLLVANIVVRRNSISVKPSKVMLVANLVIRRNLAQSTL